MLISVALISVISLSAQPEPDLDALLARIAGRIEQYYQRAQNLLCVEKVTAQPVGNDMIPAGFGRVLEYELRVESEGSADGAAPTDARVVRDLRKVNGRVPKPKDTAGCYDPNPLSPEPLAFLLAAHRSEYAFFWAGFGRGKDRNAVLIDFRPLETGAPALTEDSEGRPDCFSISLPGATKGRVWVDASTADVIRVEEHLAHPVNFSVSFEQQRRHGLPPWLSIDRYDWAIRYKPVAFNDPAETLLLPESIETLAMLRGAQSHRKRQVFSNYQRFLTNARIVKE